MSEMAETLQSRVSYFWKRFGKIIRKEEHIKITKKAILIDEDEDGNNKNI